MVVPFLLSTASRTLYNNLHRTSSSSSSATAAAQFFASRYSPSLFNSYYNPLRNQPLSRSFLFFSFGSSPSSENMGNQVQEFVDAAIKDNDIVVFSKSWCPYCAKTKKKFKDLKLDATVIEIDQRSENDEDEIQAYLGQKTKQRTVPNIFIKQEHIGGNSDLQGLSDSDIKSKASL